MENIDEMIFGLHSIAAALKNSKRHRFQIVCSEEGLSELYKKTPIRPDDLKNIEIEITTSHKVQELSQKYFKDKNLEFSRVPSNIFLITDELEFFETEWLYDLAITKDHVKILCLDQISDIHNGAAILRTASFYGVDAVIVPGRKSFGLTPSFYRIASGAVEYVPLVAVNNLSKVVGKLSDMGIMTLGLSEHSSQSIEVASYRNISLCLVLGKEDTGISNAVMRQVKQTLSLTSQGDIQSLNVGAAAAIAMEKCFGIK